MVLEIHVSLLNMADMHLILQKTEWNREMGNYCCLGMGIAK